MKEITKILSDEIQSAAGIYKINKTLKLNTVTEGEPTDNVLVHSVHNEVKSVPRSEFGKGIVDLDYSATPTGGTVFSSSGNDALVLLATTVNAGLFSPEEKVKLEGTVGGSGVVNVISKFTGLNTIGNSSLSEDGSSVSLNTNSVHAGFKVNSLVGGKFEIKNSLADTNVRNWAMLSDVQSLGAFSINQSLTRGGDPTKGVSRLYLSPTGGVSVGNTVDSGEGNLSVTGKVSASPATRSDELVTKAQLDEKTVSGTYSPTFPAFHGLTGSPNPTMATYSKIGKLVTVYITFAANQNASDGVRIVNISLPIAASSVGNIMVHGTAATTLAGVTSFLGLMGNGDTINTATLNYYPQPSGTSVARFTITYNTL